jgi:hypothetical protein
MADEPNPDEAAIAEFHRAARRRKAWIFAIAGIVALLGGIAAVLLTVLAGGEPDPMTGRTNGYEARTFILGAALIGAGAWMCFVAFRIGSGKIADIE